MYTCAYKIHTIGKEVRLQSTILLQCSSDSHFKAEPPRADMLEDLPESSVAKGAVVGQPRFSFSTLVEEVVYINDHLFYIKVSQLHKNNACKFYHTIEIQILTNMHALVYP